MSFLLFAGQAWTDKHQGATFIAAWVCIVLGLIAAYPN